MGAAESKTLKPKIKVLRDDPSQWRDIVPDFIRAVPAFGTWTHKDKTIADAILGALRYEIAEGSNDILQLVMALQRLTINPVTYAHMCSTREHFEPLLRILDPSSNMSEAIKTKTLQALMRLIAPSEEEIVALKIENKARAKLQKAEGIEMIASMITACTTSTCSEEELQAHQQEIVGALDVLSVYFGHERFAIEFTVMRAVISAVLPIMDNIFRCCCSDDDTIAAAAFRIVSGMIAEVTYEEVGELQVRARETAALVACMWRGMHNVESELRKTARFCLVLLVDGCEDNLRVFRRIVPPALSAYLAHNAVHYSNQLRFEAGVITDQMLPIPLTEAEAMMTPYNPANRPKRKDRLNREQQSYYDRQVIGTEFQRSCWRLFWSHFDTNVEHPILIFNDDVRRGLCEALEAEIDTFFAIRVDHPSEVWNDFALKIVPAALKSQMRAGPYYIHPLHRMLAEREQVMVETGREAAVLGISSGETPEISSPASPSSPAGPLSVENGVYKPQLFDLDFKASMYARQVRMSLPGFDVAQPAYVFRELSDRLVAVTLGSRSGGALGASSEEDMSLIIDTMRTMMRVQPLDIQRSLISMCEFLAALVHPDVCDARWASHLFSLIVEVVREPHPAAPLSYKQARGDAVAAFVAAGGVDSLAMWLAGFAGKSVPPPPSFRPSEEEATEGEGSAEEAAEDNEESDVENDAEDDAEVTTKAPVDEWSELPPTVRNAYRAFDIIEEVIAPRRRLARSASNASAIAPYLLSQAILCDTPEFATKAMRLLSLMAQVSPEFVDNVQRTGMLEFTVYRLVQRDAEDPSWREFDFHAATALFFSHAGIVKDKEGSVIHPSKVLAKDSHLRHFLPEPLLAALAVGGAPVEGVQPWSALFGRTSTGRADVVWDHDMQSRLRGVLDQHVPGYVSQLAANPRITWHQYRHAAVLQQAFTAFEYKPTMEIAEGVLPAVYVDYPSVEAILCVGDIYLGAFMDEGLHVSVVNRYNYFVKCLARAIHYEHGAELNLGHEDQLLVVRSLEKCLTERHEEGIEALLDIGVDAFVGLAYACCSDSAEVTAGAARALYAAFMSPEGKSETEVEDRAYQANSLALIATGMVRWLDPCVYPTANRGSGVAVAHLARTATRLMVREDLVELQYDAIVTLLHAYHVVLSIGSHSVSPAALSHVCQSLLEFIRASPAHRSIITSLGTPLHVLALAYFPDTYFASAAIVGTDKDDLTFADLKRTLSEADYAREKRRGNFADEPAVTTARVPNAVVRVAAKLLHEFQAYDDTLLSFVTKCTPAGMSPMYSVPGAFANVLRHDGCLTSDVNSDILSPRCVYSQAQQEALSAFIKSYTDSLAPTESTMEWRNQLVNENLMPGEAQWDASEMISVADPGFPAAADLGNLVGGVHIPSMLTSPDALVLDEELNEDYTFFVAVSDRAVSMVERGLPADADFLLSDICKVLRHLTGAHPRVCDTALQMGVINTVCTRAENVPFTPGTAVELASVVDLAGSLAGTSVTAQYIARRILPVLNRTMAGLAYMPLDPGVQALVRSVVYFVDRVAENGSTACASSYNVTVGADLPNCDDVNLSAAAESEDLMGFLLDYGVLGHVLRLLTAGLLVDAEDAAYGLHALGCPLRHHKYADEWYTTLCALTDVVFADSLRGNASATNFPYDFAQIADPYDAAKLIAADFIGESNTPYCVWHSRAREDVGSFLDRDFHPREFKQHLQDDAVSAWALVRENRKRGKKAERPWDWCSVPNRYIAAWRLLEPCCTRIFARTFNEMSEEEFGEFKTDYPVFARSLLDTLISNCNKASRLVAALESGALNPQATNELNFISTGICHTALALTRVWDNVGAVNGDGEMHQKMLQVLLLLSEYSAAYGPHISGCQSKVQVEGATPQAIFGVVPAALLRLLRHCAVKYAFCESIRGAKIFAHVVNICVQLSVGGGGADAYLFLNDVIEGAPMLTKTLWRSGMILLVISSAATTANMPLVRCMAARVLHTCARAYRPVYDLLVALFTSQVSVTLGVPSPDGLVVFFSTPAEEVDQNEWSYGRRALIEGILKDNTGSIINLLNKAVKAKSWEARSRTWNMRKLFERLPSYTRVDDTRGEVNTAIQRGSIEVLDAFEIDIPTSASLEEDEEEVAAAPVAAAAPEVPPAAPSAPPKPTVTAPPTAPEVPEKPAAAPPAAPPRPKNPLLGAIGNPAASKLRKVDASEIHDASGPRV